MQIFASTNKGKSILSRTVGLRRSAIGLRIAPMIDMIFLLLIFFLVAARWSPQEDFLPLQLPVANAGTVAQTTIRPEPLTIQITPTNAGCRVQIGLSRAVNISSQNPERGLASLMEQTRQCLLEQKRYATDPVEIVCAGKVKWENLAQIYNVLYGMGLTDITFQMTESPKNDKPD
ncbi:MAG: biopolymer transporter ExbD [Sedimentisphaerales bacterium]